MKGISLMLCLVVTGTVPAWAGENPSAKLAMYVVASREYLDCADLMPAACESINVEVSVAAGVELVKQEGLLIRQVVIPQLHEQMRARIL